MINSDDFNIWNDHPDSPKLLAYFMIGSPIQKPQTHVLYTMHCHHVPMSKAEFKKQTVVNVDNGYHIMMANVPMEEYKERKRLGLPILVCDKNTDLCRGYYQFEEWKT